LPGGSYLAKLRGAGFVAAEIVGTTGYATSKYTAGHYVRAVRSGR
jgi:hypothetical protein